MHKELIGKQASLRLPCSMEATELLLDFVDELMEVSGSHASEPHQLQQQMSAAVDALCRPDSPNSRACELVATLTILEESIEISLAHVGADGADTTAEHILNVRES